jgi:small subunit ribosomal protein S17
MTATQEAVQAPATTGARRNEKVGNVVSTKMQKTIVVEVEMRKAAYQVQADHAHHQEVLCPRRAELGAHGRRGRIRETRPLSKLKRWALEEIVRRSSLGQIEDAAEAKTAAAAK